MLDGKGETKISTGAEHRRIGGSAPANKVLTKAFRKSWTCLYNQRQKPENIRLDRGRLRNQDVWILFLWEWEETSEIIKLAIKSIRREIARTTGLLVSERGSYWPVITLAACLAYTILPSFFACKSFLYFCRAHQSSKTLHIGLRQSIEHLWSFFPILPSWMSFPAILKSG